MNARLKCTFYLLTRRHCNHKTSRSHRNQIPALMKLTIFLVNWLFHQYTGCWGEQKPIITTSKMEKWLSLSKMLSTILCLPGVDCSKIQLNWKARRDGWYWVRSSRTLVLSVCDIVVGAFVPIGITARRGSITVCRIICLCVWPWPRPSLSFSMNFTKKPRLPMSHVMRRRWVGPAAEQRRLPHPTTTCAIISKELRTCLILAKFELKTKSYEVPGDHNAVLVHWNVRNVEWLSGNVRNRSAYT